VYYFEINIPHYKKDSAMILFNGERVKSIIDAVPQVNRIDQSIHIYPNPVSDNFLLETDDNSIFPVTAIIKDVNGRKVTENSVNTSKTSVNTSDLKPGIYVLYLYSMQGFATKKIIKI
jgi:ABC-type transport system involved in cytochrome bd biosynthesis fused ATPase/permease subunit